MPTPLPPDFFANGKPIALVVDDSSAIGNFLARELIENGVKVISSDEEITTEYLETIERVDYVFFLTDKKIGKEAHALSKFAKEKDARFLLGIEIGNNVDSFTPEDTNSRIAKWIDVYGPGIKGEIGNILHSFVSGRASKLDLNPESRVYPLFAPDLAKALVKATVAPGTKGKTLTFTGNKFSAYELVNELRKITGKEIKVEYSHQGRKGIDEQIGPTIISWQPTTNLPDGVLKTIAWLETNKPETETRVEVKALVEEKRVQEPVREITKSSFWDKREVKVKKRFFAPVLFLAAIVFWLFALPAIQLTLGVAELTYAQKLLEKDDLKKAGDWYGHSEFWFSLSSQSFFSWGSFPGLKERAASLAKKSKALILISQVGGESASVGQKLDKLKANIFSQDNYSLKQELSNLQIDLGTLNREIGFLKAEVGQKNISFKLPFVVNQTIITPSQVYSQLQDTSFFSQFLGQLPEVLGENGPRVYMAMLSDNSEIRPSGGVIKSVAFLTFDKGRLINLEVKDTDFADSQLKGQVEPPAPLAKYANLENWDLANSGWSADFPTSATRASWFIEKELEQKTNGVISYDLEFVRALLANNKLELENGQDLTQNNLYQLAATGKNGFYSQVNRAVIKHLTEGKNSDLGLLLSFARTKHVSFWLDNQDAEISLAKQGVDGGVTAVTCQSALKFGNCLTDYLQVVDANIGGTKISQDIDKSYSLEIDVKDGVLSHRLTVTLENKSRNGQTYKTYVRAYTPATTKPVLTAEVDPQTGTQKTLDPELDSDHGKRTLGVYTEVKGNEKKQLVFIWDVPEVGLQTTKEGELVFLWQKQLGVPDEPYALRINLPDTNLKVGAYPDPGLTTDATIGYNNNLTGDLPVNIVWQPR